MEYCFIAVTTSRKKSWLKSFFKLMECPHQARQQGTSEASLMGRLMCGYFVFPAMMESLMGRASLWMRTISCCLIRPKCCSGASFKPGCISVLATDRAVSDWPSALLTPVVNAGLVWLIMIMDSCFRAERSTSYSRKMGLFPATHY
jgi:hypothetical protein